MKSSLCSIEQFTISIIKIFLNLDLHMYRNEGNKLMAYIHHSHM